MSCSGWWQSRFVKFGLVAVCLLLVSGCKAREEMLKITGGGIGTHEISAPSFELDDEALDRSDPIKLSALEILAPRKDDQIAVIRGVVKYIGGSRPAESNYLLEDDLEPPTREALSYLFEIDPTSDRAVQATLAVSSKSNYVPDRVCSYWETTMTVRLDLVFSDESDGESMKSYSSNSLDKSCAAFWWVPQAGAFDSMLNEAFQKTIEKAIKDRGELAGII